MTYGPGWWWPIVWLAQMGYAVYIFKLSFHLREAYDLIANLEFVA